MKRQPNLVLKSNLKGETPVHVAARGGHWKIVLLFRDSVRGSNDKDRVSLELVNDAGESPLSIATYLKLAVTAEAITFTAAFTIPGGFINEGPNEGMGCMATLIRKYAFKAFVITDAIAMTSSMTAAVMVFWSSYVAKANRLWTHSFLPLA
ncbi:hypothetical protein REPUB_Repub07fG0225900 [Reevesia pubescens]